MTDLPLVTRAEYRKNYRIWIEFDDGVAAEVEFERWFQGPVFEPLRDVSFFRRFFIDGGTVTWPNGADIAPETLHDAAKSRATA